MKNKQNREISKAWQKPESLKEVAERSESSEHFSVALRDWIHAMKRYSRKADIQAAIGQRPPLLRKRLEDGGCADATLAAYAEFIGYRFRLKVPAWVYEHTRTSDEPWFGDSDNKHTRSVFLRVAPSEFRERNLFTVPDIPFKPRPGRPKKSSHEIRRANADRQKRYRLRKKELAKSVDLNVTRSP